MTCMIMNIIMSINFVIINYITIVSIFINTNYKSKLVTVVTLTSISRVESGRVEVSWAI